MLLPLCLLGIDSVRFSLRLYFLFCRCRNKSGINKSEIRKNLFIFSLYSHNKNSDAGRHYKKARRVRHDAGSLQLPILCFQYSSIFFALVFLFADAEGGKSD